MIIIFRKLTPTHHLLIIKRDALPDEKQEAETKSLMPHDLIHFAYEKVTKEEWGFRWRLQQGSTIQELSHDEISPEMKLYQIELIVWGLTGYLTKWSTGDVIINAIHNMMNAYKLEAPILSIEILEETKSLFNKIRGERRSLSYDDDMVLEW